MNQWQYLTVDQALEDFAVFAKGFTIPSGSRVKLKSADALRPQKTPWIVIGASYPGVRAALLRLRNPEVVFASWASSAPVQAQINMASYFEAVERALPRNCSADWVAVTKYVDGVLMGSNTTEKIAVKRALYTAGMSGPGGNTTSVKPLSDADIMAISPDDTVEVLMYPAITFQVSRTEFTADPALTTVQSSGLRTILPFCDRVESLNFTSDPASQGLFATRGINSTFNAFATAIAEIDKSTLPSENEADEVALSFPPPPRSVLI